MKCPSCNTPGCYQGFSVVECQNAKCVHATPEAKLSKPGKKIAEELDLLINALIAGNYNAAPSTTMTPGRPSATVNNGPQANANPNPSSVIQKPYTAPAINFAGHNFVLITNTDYRCSMCGTMIVPGGTSKSSISPCAGYSIAKANPPVPNSNLVSNVNGHSFSFTNNSNDYQCSICGMVYKIGTAISAIPACTGPANPPAPPLNAVKPALAITKVTKNGHIFVSMVNGNDYQCIDCLGIAPIYDVQDPATTLDTCLHPAIALRPFNIKSHSIFTLKICTPQPISYIPVNITIDP